MEPHTIETSIETFLSQLSENKDKDLYDAVLILWKTDSFGTCQIDAHDNQEDEKTQHTPQKTYNKVDGRFKTGLLWRRQPTSR